MEEKPRSGNLGKIGHLLIFVIDFSRAIMKLG
jgi:hypothetical protein